MLKFFLRKAGGSSPDALRERRAREDAEFAAFLAAPPGRGIRVEVDRAERSRRGGGASFFDAALEQSVARAFSPPPPPGAAPGRLIALLLWRLGDRCAHLESVDSCEAFAAFLLESMGALLAIVAASPKRNAVALLERGFEERIFSVLRFARTRLLSRAFDEEHALESPILETSSSLATSLSVSQKSMWSSVLSPTAMHHTSFLTVLRDATRLHVYVRMSAVGLPRIRPNSVALRRFLFAENMPPLELPGEDVGVEMPAAEWSAGSAELRNRFMLECGRLFLCCSKGTMDLDLQPVMEREMVAEILCALALIMTAVSQEFTEQVIQASLAGTGVQLARFFAASTTREESELLLGQLSCSFVLVARMLREAPVLTLQAINSVYFVDNLVGALQALGRRYDRVTSDKNVLSAKQELEYLIDVKRFYSHPSLSDGMLFLAYPHFFQRLADSEIADEFLHCYLDLAEALCVVKARPDVCDNSVALQVMEQMELIPVKAFFTASEAFPPTSCLYDTVMQCVLSKVQRNDPDGSFIGSLKHLVRNGLYRLFFHEDAFVVFRDDPRLHYASVYFLHFMMTRPIPALSSNTTSDTEVEEEVCAVLDALLTRVDDAGAYSPLCAALFSAIHGPNAIAVVNAILQTNGVSALAAMSSKSLSVAPGRHWVPFLLTELLREPVVQSGVLCSDPAAALALLTVPTVRRDAEKMLVALLTYRCADNEYAARMAPLVRSVWDAIHRCVQSDSFPADAHTYDDNDGEKEAVFLSILRCIRKALRELSSGAYVDYWGAARQLQCALCGDASIAQDAFFCLLHRAAQPWRGGVQTPHRISCILSTVALLVRGSAVPRRSLFQTVSAAQFVECVRVAWFSTHGVSWLSFVRSILTVVYEDDTGEEDDDDDDDEEAEEDEEGKKVICKTSVSDNGNISNMKNSNRTTDSDTGINNAVHCEKAEGNGYAVVIQNPELLVPLLGIFAKISRFREKHRDALEYILSRIAHSLQESRVSLWMVANAGLFESLTALIPVVTGTALLESVLALIMTIAGHHISVRETKHFLMNIAHVKDEEERRRFVPIVIEVLNVAAYAFLNRQAERQNYIAFRERSGPTGVKAILADFPQDGYTVCLWLRLERCVDAGHSQCIFSLQGPEKRTIFELGVTSNGIYVVFQDSQRRMCERNLGCCLIPRTWVHLVVVHRQAMFPFSASEFQLFINGAEVALVNQQVPYPSIFRGFLFLGTRIEDVEQRVYGRSFAGQMTAVYFFSRLLSAKDVTNIFLGTGTPASSHTSTALASPETSGRNFAEMAAVYIDPRFGERGQLHNLAALLRGRPSEQPLVTYEGTIACNTKSIIDSICVLGALQSVVVPLFVLLVNSELPFRLPNRRATPTTVVGIDGSTIEKNHYQNHSQEVNLTAVEESTSKAVSDLLKLVDSLLLCDVVRADVVEVGLFPMIAHVLQQFSTHCSSLPQRLWNLCRGLLSDGVVVDAAYSALFLSGDLLQACTEEMQLMLIRTQVTTCSINTELFRRVRSLDVPSFLVSEIVHNYYTSSPYHHAMRAEMFSLMATAMVDPITMNDAEAVLRLVSFATRQSDVAVLLDVLRHSRYLIVKLPQQLASFLGRRHFAVELFPLLGSPLADVRNEALLYICLLVSRSRRTQELLNPALLSAHEVVHVVYDVSLAWIRDKLHSTVVDELLYIALRAALIGRFDTPLTDVSLSVEPVGPHERLLFAPALILLLQLMQRCPTRALKERAMADVTALAHRDATAWKEIVSVRGWYASIVDLYLSEENTLCSEVDGAGERHENREREAAGSAAIEQEEEEEEQKKEEKKEGEEKKEEEEKEDPLMRSAASIFARVLSQALLHEAYGASELELLIAYLVQQGAHRLLNAALVAIVREFTAALAARGREAISGAHFGLGSQVAAANLIALLCEIEDLLFYSVTAYKPGGTRMQQKSGYTEDEELIFCTHPQPSARGEITCDKAEEERRATRAASPDGQWLHTTLALRTMELITLNSALLNTGGWNGGVGFLESFVRGLRFRKGGFLRLFVRLFRVVCSFTLRNAFHVDGILMLATRFQQFVENDQGPFAIFRRQVMDHKSYTPVSSSLIIILALHHLLLRRLRFSVMEKTPLFEDPNSEILDRIKLLCILHKKPFSQMQIFAQCPPKETKRRIRLGTLEWLCKRTQNNAVADYFELASRQDFESFIVHCTLAMERDQSQEKTMATSIAQEHSRIMCQLHQLITDINLARTSILESLEQYFEESTTKARERSVESVERYEPRTAHTLSNILFNNVWTRFIDRCKGTIWDFDPPGPRSTKYLRLLEVEQQLLYRGKMFFDPNGTDYEYITHEGKAKRQADNGQNDDLPSPPRLRLRGGEGVLLLSNEESEEEETLMPVVDSSLGTDLKELNESAVLFSTPCEVPYMMHCWSATLMIKGHHLCVFFDEINTAYNQRIADEAEAFLIKPRSIVYHSGYIALLAPGRRFRMQRTAIELWFRDGRSVLINFSDIPSMRVALSNIRTASERHKAAYLPLKVFHENPRKEVLLMRRVEQWRDGEISNFEYLLWLNFFAGRTVNDLTQYPVFPWVIADYKSDSLDLNNPSTFRNLTLPVGIVGGEQCRERVKMRYDETKEFGDVPAHYFTHYSSPAVTLYYMVRVEPFTALQVILQGGHFDHADRMFHSLLACWQGVTTNSQDVRELIPELYYLPELCMNNNRVDFGMMQDKKIMDALELPPWAHGDPYEFVYRMREALESDFVSSTLHHWIDLIFGCKQRGKEAIEALNVFNWHTYEDLDKSRGNDVDPQQLIDSLDNIGQTPIQLFTRRHDERHPQEFLDPFSTPDIPIGVKSVDIRRVCGRVARIAVFGNDRLMAVSGSGAALLFRLSVATRVARRARRGQPANFDIFEDPERRILPLPPGVVPSTTNKLIGPCESDNVAVMSVEGELFVLIGGLFDNSVVIRPLAASSSGEVRLTAHRGRVVRVAASVDGPFIVTGAEDTTFIVWSCHTRHGRLHLGLLFTVYGHEDNPTAVDVSPAVDLVATASRDGVLMLHSLRSSRLERKLRHPEKYAIDRILIQAASYVPNVLFVSNADYVIHQISVNGAFLRSVTAPGRIISWGASFRQYFIVVTSPLRKSSASNDCCGTVHFMHSFFISPLRAVPCPQLSSESVISSCAVHPLNSNVVFCGTTDGSLLLLRAES